MEFETPFSRPSRQNLAVDTSADSEIARALAENERGDTRQIRFDSDLARRLYEQEAQDRARVGDQRGQLRVHGDTEVDRSTGSQLAALPSVQIRPRTNDPLAQQTKDAGTQRLQLLEMLETCALEELHVFPDGNCQFRALSDQLFRGQQHHAEVRRQVVQWLRLHPSRYQEYVPQNFADYCQEMAADGTWGDHVTLQAAADCYGVEIRLLTSYESSCVIDITPQMASSERTLYLSFWAELHYNSVYPAGEVPQQQQHGRSGSGQGREGGGIDVLMVPLKGLNDAIQTVGKHSMEHLKKVPHAVNGIFGEIKNVGERLKGGRKG